MAIFFNPSIVIFLVVMSIVYWAFIKSDKAQLYFVTGLSIVILTAIHPYYVPFLFFICCLVWTLKGVYDQKALPASRIITITVIMALLMLILGKYGREMVLRLYGQNDWLSAYVIVPIGISYLFMRIIHFMFDYCRGTINQPTFIKLVAYIFFLPTFPAGPVETYNGFYDKRIPALPNKEFFVASIQRIITGYFQKVVIVEYLYHTSFFQNILQISNASFHLMSPVKSIIFAIIIFTRAYFDLAAYSNLAIGFAGLFGFRIMENFDYPFLKKNLSEFWQSWHISLSSWCRNNVFFPVYGMTRKAWISMYASMVVMGLWHYANLSWLAWGLHHASGLVFLIHWNEWKRRHKRLRVLASAPIFNSLSYLLTFFYVAIGYSFVGTTTFLQGLKIYLNCLLAPIYIVTKLVNLVT